MIIKDNASISATFKMIDIGTVFIYENECYIRTETACSYDVCVNCVNLKSGEFDWMDSETEVIARPNAFLTVE